MNKKPYFLYILLGLLCPIIIGIYYINDMACVIALRSLVIAAIISTTSAILAMREYRDEAEKEIWHRISFLIPLIGIPLIAIGRLIHLGLNQDFFTERLPAFFTMELLAASQFIFAVLMFRGLVFKRGEERLMPNIGVKIMRFRLGLRNIGRDTEAILRDVGVKEGQTVVDYGCGIGNFTFPAAKIVGKDGTVYAMDIHPMVIKLIDRKVRKGGFGNIKTVLTRRETGLADRSVDIVLLYDVLQMIKDKEKLIRELHRVLKPDCMLSATPEHMDADEFMRVITGDDLFTLIKQKETIYNFRKVEAE
ncbi:MAG: methyltransferase domain-containing protein [Thermoplasmata archaeon]|nr:methyltransferase domain-containing protein [Thermoplasmata archaeon]